MIAAMVVMVALNIVVLSALVFSHRELCRCQRSTERFYSLREEHRKTARHAKCVDPPLWVLDRIKPGESISRG